MNRLLLLLLLAGLVALAVAVYRARSARTTAMDPHAEQEIHKAQKR